MNRFTYDAMNSFVPKRAVGYSAGMINYFFRGNIDMIADPSQPGTYLIKNLGTEILSGTFALYYDDDEDFRKQVTSWNSQFQPAGRSTSVPSRRHLCRNPRRLTSTLVSTGTWAMKHGQPTAWAA